MTDEPSSKQAENALHQDIEVCDVEPTESEQAEQCTIDIQKTKTELDALQERKTTTQNEITKLEIEIAQLKNQVVKFQEQTNTVTKKVAATEVYTQLLRTNKFLIAQLIIFLFLNAFVKFNQYSALINVAFIATFIYQFVTNKKKLEYLKGKYNL